VDTFREFVEHGGVLIALHGVLASFKGNERWEELIGVRFSGHAPPGRLSISPTPGATRAGLSFPELQLYDEQYQFSPVSDTTVLATSDGGGNPVPTFWYRDHGDGRVISLALGHGRRSVRSNAFRTLLDAALDLGSRAK
jgi:type 1 glutamine amidotransferase